MGRPAPGRSVAPGAALAQHVLAVARDDQPAVHADEVAHVALVELVAVLVAAVVARGAGAQARLAGHVDAAAIAVVRAGIGELLAVGYAFAAQRRDLDG